MSFLPIIKFARAILRPALKQMKKGVPPSLEKLQRDYDELIELSHEVAEFGGLISEQVEAAERARLEAEAAERARLEAEAAERARLEAEAEAAKSSKKNSKAEPK